MVGSTMLLSVMRHSGRDEVGLHRGARDGKGHSCRSVGRRLLSGGDMNIELRFGNA